MTSLKLVRVEVEMRCPECGETSVRTGPIEVRKRVACPYCQHRAPLEQFLADPPREAAEGDEWGGW